MPQDHTSHQQGSRTSQIAYRTLRPRRSCPSGSRRKWFARDAWPSCPEKVSSANRPAGFRRDLFLRKSMVVAVGDRATKTRARQLMIVDLLGHVKPTAPSTASNTTGRHRLPEFSYALANATDSLGHHRQNLRDSHGLLARPKRFELLTPKFVDCVTTHYSHRQRCFHTLANRKLWEALDDRGFNSDVLTHWVNSSHRPPDPHSASGWKRGSIADANRAFATGS